MSTEATAIHAIFVGHLQEVAWRALRKYDLPSDATATLINISENATYRVGCPSTADRWALRIHREGYHSKAAIASEIAWQQALRADGAAVTPVPIAGLDGRHIQTIDYQPLGAPRNVVLYAWEAGREPDQNNIAGFELLGESAARMHAHVRRWKRPDWFERFVWDFETTLGPRPHWGRWQDGMGMTPAIAKLMGRAVATIERRLQKFGKGPQRFGLIHCDMRLANLLVEGSTVKVIDFDDCGFSWLLYDCATTVSFFEHAPEVPEQVAAWVRGYRRVGALSAEDEAEIDTFIVLRRLVLTAWIGSHAETDLAKSMGEQYTRDVVPLLERYLAKFEHAG